MSYAYESGEKRCWVVLGVLGIQRGVRMAGPLLKSTWTLLRGWRRLEPIKTRVPIPYHVLCGVLIFCLARGFHFRGALLAEWWSTMLEAWLAFSALLRPGEVGSLRVGDLLFPVMMRLRKDRLWLSASRIPKRRDMESSICIGAGKRPCSVARLVVLWPRPEPQTTKSVARRWSVLFRQALEEMHRWSRPETLQRYSRRHWPSRFLRRPSMKLGGC